MELPAQGEKTLMLLPSFDPYENQRPGKMCPPIQKMQDSESDKPVILWQDLKPSPQEETHTWYSKPGQTPEEVLDPIGVILLQLFS